MGDPYSKALAKAEAEGIALPNTVEHLRASASAFLLKSTTPVDKDKDALPSFSLFGSTDPTLNQPPLPDYYLPSKYLPGFWPLFTLGTIMTLHALILLLQVWLVRFKCWVRFRTVSTVQEATHVYIHPRAHKGKKELLPLEKGGLGTCFTMQRRKYLYDPADKTFHKVRCKVDWPLGFFSRWKGFASDAEVADAQVGLN